MEETYKSETEAIANLKETGRVICVKAGKNNQHDTKRRVCHTEASISNFFNGDKYQSRADKTYEKELKRRRILNAWNRPCNTPGCEGLRVDKHRYCSTCISRIKQQKEEMKALMEMYR